MLKRKEIKKAIKDKRWQKFRISLKGESTRRKLILLEQWKIQNKNSRKSQIQVENYLNALRRGGLLN